MRNEIEAALRQIAGAHVPAQMPKTDGASYEILLMTGLARELHGRGYAIEFMHADGTTLKTAESFTPHGGGPRHIPKKSAAGAGPMTIIFCKPGQAHWWEIINGIQYEGRSGCAHEIDVTIVPRAITDWVRNNGGGRPFGHAPFSVECKFRVNDGTLDEMRECVARHYDLTILLGHPPNLNSHNARLYAEKGTPQNYGNVVSNYRAENYRSFSSIVRKTSFSGWGSASNLTRLADYYQTRCYANADVATAPLDSFFSEAADWIDANL